LRIFLSSTSEDLRQHRSQVAEAIERLQQQSLRMETFGALPRSPLDACRRKAASADALVVIVAHRYGWVPTAEQGGDGVKSVTWHEVDAALEAGRPVFAFLVDTGFAWTGPREENRLVEAETDQEAQAVFAAVRGLKELKRFWATR
jgi:Domain of unknown function (DUF4062)